MRRVARVAAAVSIPLALPLVLASCGGSQPSASASSAGTSVAAAASGDGQTLVVYTNSNTDGRAEWVTEQAKSAGMDIKIVGQGGGDTTNKLLAEKANPVADVVFGLNNMYFESLKKGGVVDSYKPAWSDKVDASLADTDGVYWPLVKQGIVLAYNANKLSADAAPKDWTDLWTKPEFKKRYESQTGLGGATTQLVFAGLFNRYKDANGELGVSAEGWNQIKAYFDNGSPAVKDKDLYARMKAGEVDMGQMYTSGILARDKKYEIKTGLAQPAVGVPFAVEQIALVKGSKKADQAKKFIDWFGSAQTQGAFAKKFDSVPVNKDALSQANPEAVKMVEGLKKQDIDWKFAQENMPKWIEKIELQYLK